MPARSRRRASTFGARCIRCCVLSLATLMAVLAASPARAQFGESIPGVEYFLAVEAFYHGEYRDAERALRRETQRGVRTAQSRWVDAICHHAMLGEVLYQQGRNAEALIEFDQACQVLVAYPDWMVRLKPDPIRPGTMGARRQAPWGQSQRNFVPGYFPRTMQIAVGRIDNRQAIEQGGVVVQPQYWRVDAAEIVRAASLAMRRRAELLGSLAEHDRISKDLVDVLSRGNLSPTNHWTSAWIDLQRGVALAAQGKFDEADNSLGRAVLADGQFDHPLTCVALLEQGRVAMRRGDSARAASLLAEAGFSAYYFENWDALTEAVWLGWANHMLAGAQGMYPPLPPVAAWAQTNRLMHTAGKLRLAEAESMLWAGQVPQAAAAIDDISRRLGEMRNGLTGIHALYLQANVYLQQRQIAQGGEVLGRALAAQANTSHRNFQISLTSQWFDGGALRPREVVDVFATLLADPTLAEWALAPLDAVAVLKSNHQAAFDRWFLAALERKDIPLALEIAEAAKRRRYLSAQPLGGRLAALRTLLEAPLGELSPDAILQRQQLLTAFPDYRQLAIAGEKLFGELRAGRVVAAEGADTKPLAQQYDAWTENAAARETMLMQLSMRRLPSSLEFPPQRSTADLQKALGKGEALVVFHAAAGNLYGFLVTADGTHLWQLGEIRRLRTTLGNFLRDLGNYNATRALTVAELKSVRWRDSATRLYQAVFENSRLDPAQTTALVIVPDDVLWYLPFEALVPDAAASTGALTDRLTIRYGPTAALAVGNRREYRRPQHTGIAANQYASAAKEAGDDDVLQQLESAVTGPVRLSQPLPEPGYVIAPLLDALISLDEVETARDAALGWSPLPRSKGAAADDTLAKWYSLPYGGPEWIVITGFATAAEQGLRAPRRNGSRTAAAQPGNEIFQAVCGLMANGARTVLLTRWRTDGRTNFELVREFVGELPHIPAAEAWQRACLLAREAPLDITAEPRLKRAQDGGELPTAEHPFFWAGYLLVDAAPPQAHEPTDEAARDAAKPGSAKPDAATPGATPSDSAKPGDQAPEGAPPATSTMPAAPVDRPLPPPIEQPNRPATPAPATSGENLDADDTATGPTVDADPLPNEK